MQIAEAVSDMGTPVSPPVVQDWMQEQGLALHKIQKVLPGGQSPDRDRPFQRLAELKGQYTAAGNPVFSMDTKAKEHLGQLFRAGRVWTQKAFEALDHDFPSWATGVIIPHGIYDIARNRGHLNIGLSHDTSLFACDSFRWYSEPHRPTLLPGCHVYSSAVRWRREQFGDAVPLQTGPARPGQ
jgi:hypothetical protein